MFKKIFKKKKTDSDKETLLLEGHQQDLNQCDLCENMLLVLKKCENCYEKKLCNHCLKTEKLCNSCNIKYQEFCKSLYRLKNLHS